MREDGRRVGYILGKTPGADRILLYDDMEGLLKWGGVFQIPFFSCERGSYGAYDGNYGLGVWTGYVAPGLPITVYAGRGCCLLGPRLVRFECVFRTGVDDASVEPELKGAQRICMVVRFRKGNVLRYAGFGINWFQSRFEVLTFFPTWTSTGASWREFLRGGFHRLALVVNIPELKYVSAEVDSYVLDLSGFGIFGFVSSGGEFGQVFCGVGGFEEGRFSGWFDDVLVRRV